MPETTPTQVSGAGAARDPCQPRGFPQAVRTLVGWQRALGIAVLVGLVVWAVLDYRTELLVVNCLFTFFYFLVTVYRVLLIDLSLRHARELRIAPEQIAAGPAGGEWPRYLVLVPVYHEGAVLPALVDAMDRLDYPKDRMEVRLLVEEDDHETLAAARALDLKPPVVVYPVPFSLPRTKPKACNVGLAGSEAEYLVIFDAEDRPEPDQLKKAALAFAALPREVGCVQAKLSFYNPDRNVLTRCFTVEYATWFDLCLPGLDAMKAPIPLGGTSNHFRLEVLRKLGGWDEYNVTEDCDLGLRLFLRGWQTRILDSTTWEQACPDLRYWIRQRSRWVKGYIQTYIVHTRHPWQLCRTLGFGNSLHFHLLIGGTPFCQLISPLYWVLTLLWLVWRPAAVEAFFPGPIFAVGAFCLFGGNFIFAYTSGIAAVRRGFGHLTKYGLVMPFYWMLMSVGAWRGLWGLVRRPHHWDKTKHFAEPVAPAAKPGGA